MEKARLILTKSEARDIESLLSLTIPITELDIPVASVPFTDGCRADLSVLKRRFESEIHLSVTLFDKNGDEEDWKDKADPYGIWKMRTWYGGEYEIEILRDAEWLTEEEEE